MPCVYNATGPQHPLAEFFEAIQKNVQGFHDLNGDDQFVPEVDIFDTPEAFILHASLPGAIREDIGVEFDADTNEIQISGVVHRNANEELLRKLVIKGRGVGVFKRKFRLGTHKRPTSVDSDHITAKLENGILSVLVPKHEGDAREKRKVEIQ
ncbi:HSP20-like chaperone [Terfezia claveryi]|nr:HSP20-like chaperone [Terfezia claveryi]